MYIEKRSPKQIRIRMAVSIVIVAIGIAIVCFVVQGLRAQQTEQQKEELEKTILQA